MSIDPPGSDPAEFSDPDAGAFNSSAPPIVRGEIRVPQPKPRWPKVLGVIEVVFGGGGILAYCWGIVSMTLLRQFYQAGGELPDEFISLNVASSAINLLPAALLLPAGIGLLKRQPWGVRLTRIWAAVKIVLTAVVAALTYLMQEKIWSAMARQNPGLPQIGSMEEVMVTASAVFALLWGWALPVFVLIFLSRARVREQIAAWD